MLTREEAKQCKCAYVTIDIVNDVNMKILEAGGTKEELRQTLTDWLESTRCIAENCPKWKDVRIGDNKCKKNKCNMYSNHSIEKYIEHCLDCKHHFGICNG